MLISRLMPIRPVEKPQIDPRFVCYQVEIRKSVIHRFGVYAKQRIPANRKVIEYTGERLNRRQAKARGDKHMTYLFSVDDYWTLDGAVGGSGAEYINHSCEPNCFAEIVKERILYKSKRAIQPGEELTVDYRFDTDVDRVDCKCGMAACRGTINLKG